MITFFENLFLVCVCIVVIALTIVVVVFACSLVCDILKGIIETFKE